MRVHSTAKLCSPRLDLAGNELDDNRGVSKPHDQSRFQLWRCKWALGQWPFTPETVHKVGLVRLQGGPDSSSEDFFGCSRRIAMRCFFPPVLPVGTKEGA